MQNDLSRAKRAIESFQKAAEPFNELRRELLQMLVFPCKHCKVVPVLSDVGGNNAYYEIGCNCEKGMVVGSHDRAETITCWNILNERSD